MQDQGNAAEVAPMPYEPKTYRVKAVADRLDVHTATIYRLVKSGELRSIRVRGSIRIPAAALAAYLEQAGEVTR